MRLDGRRSPDQRNANNADASKPATQPANKRHVGAPAGARALNEKSVKRDLNIKSVPGDIRRIEGVPAPTPASDPTGEALRVRRPEGLVVRPWHSRPFAAARRPARRPSLMSPSTRHCWPGPCHPFPSNAASNCCASVRATSRRVKSPTTMPLAPTFGFCMATRKRQHWGAAAAARKQAKRRPTQAGTEALAQLAGTH